MTSYSFRYRFAGEVHAARLPVAARTPEVQFIGRCGTYQYLDMHQVINQSLMGAQRWLAEQGRVAMSAAS